MLNGLFILLLWGIPITLSVINYRKLPAEEQNDVKKDLKRPSLYLSIGLLVIGFMIWFSGSITQVEMLHIIGAIAMVVGGLNILIFGWVRREISVIRGIWFLLWLLAFTFAFIYWY